VRGSLAAQRLLLQAGTIVDATLVEAQISTKITIGDDIGKDGISVR